MRERLAHEGRQIDRTQQTRAIVRQGLLATWVGRVDRLAIIEIVAGVDAVDKNHARLGGVVGGPHQPVPQFARGKCAVDPAFELQIPWLAGFHSRHEAIGHENRQIEIAQTARVCLRPDELLDIGVIAAHRCHHSTTARAGRHDGAAHGVPHVHETHGPGRIGANAGDTRAARPQRREIMTDSAARLQRERRLAHLVENGAEIIVDAAHDKAIEQRDGAAGAGTRQNASTRQKSEICHGAGECLRPALANFSATFFDARCRARHAPERIVQRRVGSLRCLRALETVFGLPDL